MAFDSETPPRTTPVTTLKTDPMTGEEVDSHLMSEVWIQWLYHIVDRLDRTARILGKSSVTGITGNLGVTNIPMPPQGTGLYRVSYYVSIVEAGSGNNTIALTLYWTEGGVPRTQQGPTLTTARGAYQTGSVLIRSDGGKPISYSATVNSSGGTPMKYNVDVVVEGVVT